MVFDLEFQLLSKNRCILRKIIKFLDRFRAKQLKYVEVHGEGALFRITLEKLAKDEKVFYVLGFLGADRARFRISELMFLEAKKNSRFLLNMIESGSYEAFPSRPVTIIPIPYSGSIAEIIGLTSILVPKENIKYHKNIFSRDGGSRVLDMYICKNSSEYYCLLSAGIMDIDAKNIYQLTVNQSILFLRHIIDF